MLRSIVVLLLLAVFFLTGMLYGLHKDEAIILEEPKAEQLDESKEDLPVSGNEKGKEDSPDISSTSLQMEEPTNLTQKTASIMEAGVKGFYEAIVQIMYQISQVFF